jgi:membrane protease YdiL (CAAX protease family)
LADTIVQGNADRSPRPLDYATLSSAVYTGALLVTMGAALLLAMLRPALVRRAGRSPHRAGWWAVLACLMGAIGAWIAGGAAGESLGSPEVAQLASGVGLMALMALLAFPVAVGGGPGDTPSPAAGRAAPIAIGLLATLVWSYALFPLLMHVGGATVADDFFLGGLTAARPWEFLAISCLALAAAVLEEFLFRGAMMGLLRRLRLPLWLVIVLPAAVWAIGHVGYIQPHGFKELQIFVLGVIFGWVRVRAGLTAAVWLHLANNAGALLVQAFTLS